MLPALASWSAEHLSAREPLCNWPWPSALRTRRLTLWAQGILPGCARPSPVCC